MTLSADEQRYVEIAKRGYRAVFDQQRHQLSELADPQGKTNWLADGDRYRFGAPFVNGTQSTETFLELTSYHAGSGTTLATASRSGASRVDYAFSDDHLDIVARLPVGCGPRTGLELDLNLLDLPTGTPWTEQVLPVVIYTAEDFSYAYFIWQRRTDEYLVMAIAAPFAAWRFKYSYAGHRLEGLQVLSQADDVVTRDGLKLPTVDTLRIRLAFASSLPAAYQRLCDLLGISITGYALSGGTLGSSVALTGLGDPVSVAVRAPDGSEGPLALEGGRAQLHLKQPGLYEVATISASGKRHTSRLLCLEPWETLYGRVNQFSRQHFQHDTGAFYRAVDRSTLSAEGKRTLSGVAFGDPYASHRTSCRTGEFGGFCGWAMIKQMLMYGPDPALAESAKRYIRNWALNEGREGEPLPGTVCKQPVAYGGLNWSAYHLYEQLNYAQYEAWLIGELVDYFRLTGDEDILQVAVNLANHFVGDHVRPNGMVVCQNSADGPEKDYTTVGTPGTELLTLGRLLAERGDERAAAFLEVAGRIADHLVARGLSFPTEGEPSTEDGSMACTAATLLACYLHLEPKPEYLRLGQDLIELHDRLMLKGFDCRLNGSSFRSWETQFETSAWGPSVNAGHGWTIWTAEAKLSLYHITGQTRWLCEAYASFLSVLSNVDASGGIFPCYTPDMIPGTPQYPGGEREPDLRQTTPYLALGQPDSYSASGTYALIRAEECWSRVSGLVLEDGTAINGRLDVDGTFVSAAPKFDRLALSGVPHSPLAVRTEPGQTLTVTFDAKRKPVILAGGRLLHEDERSITCSVETALLRIGGESL